MRWVALACVAFSIAGLAGLSGAGTSAVPTSSAPGGTPTFVGDDACLACHQDIQKDYEQTVHAKLFRSDAHLETMRQGCEGCHGPGSDHVAAGGGKGVGGMIQFGSKDPADITRANTVCLQCHLTADRIHWNGSTHEMQGVSCASCHNVMKNVSTRNLLEEPSQIGTCGQCYLIEKAQTLRYGHMPLRDGTIPDRDGKMTCTSCHNPHGSVNDALLKFNTVNEACYACHADKRGPFLWEHPPVLENCMNCHDPHGSPREYMLRMAPPRLCQTCHNPTDHPTDPLRPTNSLVIGSGCMQCHARIHGSNHPSGQSLTR